MFQRSIKSEQNHFKNCAFATRHVKKLKTWCEVDIAMEKKKHGVKLTSQNCKWKETDVNVTNLILQKVKNVKTLCKVDVPEVPID